MITKKLIEAYEKYKADELLSIFIHKWLARGFIAWVISALLFQLTLPEFIFLLIPLLVYITWMIRAEWKQYKQWFNVKGGRI